jgi:hypothetical protein
MDEQAQLKFLNDFGEAAGRDLRIIISPYVFMVNKLQMCQASQVPALFQHRRDWSADPIGQCSARCWRTRTTPSLYSSRKTILKVSLLSSLDAPAELKPCSRRALPRSSAPCDLHENGIARDSAESYSPCISKVSANKEWANTFSSPRNPDNGRPLPSASRAWKGRGKTRIPMKSIFEGCSILENRPLAISKN